MGASQNELTAGQDGLNTIMRSADTMKKFAKLIGLDFAIGLARDWVANTADKMFTDTAEEIAQASQPDVVLKQKMVKASERIRTQLLVMQTETAKDHDNPVITNDVRDKLVKSYQGLVEYKTMDEGIVGLATLRELNLINEEVMAETELMNPDEKEEVITKLCEFNQEVSDACRDFTTKEQMMQVFKTAGRDLGKDEIDKQVSGFEKMVEDNQRRIELQKKESKKLQKSAQRERAVSNFIRGHKKIGDTAR